MEVHWIEKKSNSVHDWSKSAKIESLTLTTHGEGKVGPLGKVEDGFQWSVMTDAGIPGFQLRVLESGKAPSEFDAQMDALRAALCVFKDIKRRMPEDSRDGVKEIISSLRDVINNATADNL